MKQSWLYVLTLPCFIQIGGTYIEVIHPVVEFSPLLNTMGLMLLVIFALMSVWRHKPIVDLVIPMLCCLLGLLHSSAADSLFRGKSQGETLKVFCLNVGQFGNDTSSVAGVIRLIDQVNPDIVFLQEFGLYYKWPDVYSMSSQFAASIEMDNYHFEPHKDNIFGTAVFSRYKIDTSVLIFNQASVTNEGWLHRFTVDNQSIVFANVHLESYDLGHSDHWDFSAILEGRTKQIDKVNDALKDYPNHCIVGDLNTLPATPLYRKQKAKRTDALRENGLGWKPTLNTLPIKIDHVFHAGSMAINAVEILPCSFSDHKPIVFEITL